ncbi:50S ribosomal protein L17 [Desulfohalobium retbaense]|uniref:Large ribosomal subunit protein bL17 n=1 Tax=Desulfohalobium retbaense (strain ATCC 49708 / DSM 5692 / JCM 16813 / HR100) TaxID=485915 RepID=C8X448_DESRD|nr:50S ribosomal protein L17 [Desulfohalobium retbaense]ACV69322.1 ribosomal protein L17 [Desulfohalobium retbaense DSM 5692]
MRHKKSGRKLNRTWEHRKALMRNQVKSLLTNEQIRTTEAKAKELRKLADRLISMGLENTVHARRKAYKVLGNHALVKKLFDEVAPRYTAAKGGYTRVIKLGEPRRGDAAPMAMVAFVEPRQAGSDAASTPEA